MARKAATLEQRLKGRTGFAKDQADDTVVSLGAVRRTARRNSPAYMRVLRSKIETRATREMNRIHALIELDSDVVVCTTRLNHEGEIEHLYRKDHILSKLYLNKPVLLPKVSKDGRRITTEKKNPIDIWMHHPARRKLDGIINAPGMDMPNYINLWTGWGTQPRLVPAIDDQGQPKIGEDGKPLMLPDFSGTACRRILDHVRDVLAAGDLALYRWMLAWFADIVQNPRDKKPSALMIYGAQGSGKSILSETVFPKIFGSAFNLERSTNFIKEDAGEATAAGRLLIAADEAIFAGDPRAAADLKTFISQKKVGMRKLYQNKVTVANTARLLATVNPQSSGGHVVAMENDDRRWTITECAAHKVGDDDYFAALVMEIDNGGAEAFHAFLLNPSLLEGVNIRRGFGTAPGIEQKIYSLPTPEAYLYECLRSRSVQITTAFTDEQRDEWADDVLKVGQQELYKGYLEWCNSHRKTHRASVRQFYEVIRKLFYGGNVRPGVDDGRYNNNNRYWKLPPIETAREQFQKWIRCEDRPEYIARLWTDAEFESESDAHDEAWASVPDTAATNDTRMRQLDEEIPF